MNLPRHRRSRGRGAKPPPPMEILPIIKIVLTKHYVFSVSASLKHFRVQQYACTTD